MPGAFRPRSRSRPTGSRGRCFETARIERMVRTGPAGPEGSRRPDVDDQEPAKTHPSMDGWGGIDCRA
ncbi:DUF5954 family protein [Streptomyces sp. NPDC048295]|uniref:DUF5954 family protein n=1 Tax=Streptomyces sp. NPDC048295 TaxID=3154617 RepID=UPI0034430118